MGNIWVSSAYENWKHCPGIVGRLRKVAGDKCWAIPTDRKSVEQEESEETRKESREKLL